MAKKKSKRTPGKKVIRKTHAKKSSKKAGGGSGGGGAAEVARAVATLRWAHGMTGKLCAGFGEHQMLTQTCPTDNHLVWQIGHMATAYGWFGSLLDGKPASLGEPFDKLFGFGSKPAGDRGVSGPRGDPARA